MSNQDNIVGKRLAFLREKAGFSQVELAKKFNVSPSTIAMWELGERDIKSSNLIKIADFFNVQTDFLTGRTDTPAESGQASELTPEELAKIEKLKHEEVAFKDFLEDPIEAQREFLQAYELFKEMKKKRDQGKGK